MEVPDTLCPLETSGRQRFQDGLSSLQQDQGSNNDYGIHKYCAAMKLLHEILESASSSSDSG